MTDILPPAPPVAQATEPLNETETAPLPDIRTGPPVDENALREAAFSVHAFSWNGRVLSPFALGVESDWRLHRSQLNAPLWSEVLTADHYQASLPDVARILWFCSHEPETWLEFLALQPRHKREEGTGVWVKNNPHIALEKRIRDWAATEIGGDPQKQLEAYHLIMQLMESSRKTRAEVIVKDEGDDAPL
jgi:hypothetical protein